MKINTRNFLLTLAIIVGLAPATSRGQTPQPLGVVAIPAAEFAAPVASAAAAAQAALPQPKTGGATPIPTALDYLPPDSPGIQRTAAQLGMSRYTTPADSPYLNNAPSPYGNYPMPQNGTSQVDPNAPKLPPGTLTHDKAGRLIMGAVDGNWYDYCGPDVRPCYPHIYASADAWFMHRNDATWKNLAQSATTGGILGRSRDPDFNLESVAKVTVGKAFCDWTIEASAIYKDDIDAHTDGGEFGATNAIFFGLQPIGSDFRNANTMRFSLNDQLHSYEANLFNTVEFLQWMVGVRYVEFNETLDVLSSAATGTSNADIVTHNRMLGGQVGLRAKYDWSLYGFESNLKLGMYYNDANTGTFVRDANNTAVIRNLQTNGQNEAYLSELNLIFTYNPTLHFGLRAGYQFMYINEIALAPDQIVPANSGLATGVAQNAKGDMWMHGPMLGAEWKW
jgi:hypothetical protein